MPTAITSVDFIRINATIANVEDRVGPRVTAMSDLKRRILQASIVEPERIENDRVTMNTRVVLSYPGSEEHRLIQLVYPGTSKGGYDPGRVSILSPLGAALLGARKGETIHWTAPAGEQQAVVEDIIYQPEASGDPF